MAEADELTAQIETATEGLFAVPPGPDDLSVSDNRTKPPWLSKQPIKRKRKPWPKIATCSAYRVTLALTCMLKFAFRYFDQRKDPSGYEAGVGKLVHGVFEDAANWRLHKKFKGLPSVASVDELLHLLEWQEAQFALEGEGFDVTGSMLEEARQILIGYGPFDLHNVAGAEQTGTLRVTQTVVVGMFIDRIDLEGPHGDPHTVTIWDYKTNQLLPTSEELQMNTQANLYLAWARARWPNAREIRFRYENIRHGKTFWLRWTRFRHDLHLARTRMAQNTWTQAKQAHHGQSIYPAAQIGSHCRWCPYREGDKKYMPCAAYQAEVEKLAMADKHPGGMERHDLPELLQIYRTSKIRGDLHEARKTESRGVIVRKMGDQQKYRDGCHSATLSQDRIRAWDMKLTFLRELAKATGVKWEDLVNDVMSIQKTKVDQFINTLEGDAVKKIAQEISVEYQSLGLSKPKLTVREVQTWF